MRPVTEAPYEMKPIKVLFQHSDAELAKNLTLLSVEFIVLHHVILYILYITKARSLVPRQRKSADRCWR